MISTNNRYRAYLFLALLILLSAYAIAQENYDMNYREEALRNTEQIYMFTDRNIYSVNEHINFRAFYSRDKDASPEISSRVLYVELIPPSGISVSKGKYHLDADGCSGYLSVPPDIPTGNYFLRSYTTWMRNFGPGHFSYVPLKIINPFKTDLVQTRNNNSLPDEPEPSSYHSSDIICRPDRSAYSPGEEVEIEVIPDGSHENFTGGFCLTVIPEGLSDNLSGPLNTFGSFSPEDFTFDHLPEIRGITLSGSVIKSGDGSPETRSRLHFSILGEQAPDYLSVFTDELGRFIITIPERTGTLDFFVAHEKPDERKTEIRITQDFVADPVPFRVIPFQLSAKEKKAAERMALNMQLSSFYGKGVPDPQPARPTETVVPFYGIPDQVINFDDFVMLPTMVEVFENIVPDVLVMYSHGEPYVRIGSISRTIAPLILVDGIPIFDQKALFSLEPSRIRKIELITDPYLKGEAIFGGVLILTSLKGDMASIDLPEGSYFFDYQAYDQGDRYFDKSEGHDLPGGQEMVSGRVPDTRNTVFWTDNLDILPGKKEVVRFFAPEQSGEYRVIVRGVSSEGNAVSGTGSFRIVVPADKD